MTWLPHPKSRYAKTSGPYTLTEYRVMGKWIYVLWRGQEKVGQGMDEEELKRMVPATEKGETE